MDDETWFIRYSRLYIFVYKFLVIKIFCSDNIVHSDVLKYKFNQLYIKMVQFCLFLANSMVYFQVLFLLRGLSVITTFYVLFDRCLDVLWIVLIAISFSSVYPPLSPQCARIISVGAVLHCVALVQLLVLLVLINYEFSPSSGIFVYVLLFCYFVSVQLQ